MKKNVCFYIEGDVKLIHNAYINAASSRIFNRICKQEPFYKISFNLEFSFEYNINGGTCEIHLMPYGTGTAVLMHFSIMQLVGAQCESYANDLNRVMQSFLPVSIFSAAYAMEDFMNPMNQVRPQPVIRSAQSAQPLSQSVQEQKSNGNLCSKCGNTLEKGSRFCDRCGSAVSADKVCPNCSTRMPENAVFCNNCGTRL